MMNEIIHKIDPIKKPNEKIPIKDPAIATSKCLLLQDVKAAINGKIDKRRIISEHPIVPNESVVSPGPISIFILCDDGKKGRVDF